MAVTLQQVKAGIGNYADAELGRKAQGVTKFGVYFMLPRVDKLIDKYYNQAVNNPLFADMFDESGNVDIDAVYDALWIGRGKLRCTVSASGGMTLICCTTTSAARCEVKKMKEHLEKLCYQVNDLYADAMKWKGTAFSAETENERNAAKKYADDLFAMYKDEKIYGVGV